MAADPDGILQQRHGSSRSSDQATDTAFHMSSCSPEQRGKDLPSCTGARKDLQSCIQSTEVSVDKAAATRRTSTSISCQAGDGLVLSPSCFAPSKLSAAAMSMCSIAPFDMAMPLTGGASSQRHVPRSQQQQQQVDDAHVNGLIDRARGIKHAVDKEQRGKRWTVRALCKYLESALVYMEACENSHQATAKSSRRTAWWVRPKSQMLPRGYIDMLIASLDKPLCLFNVFSHKVLHSCSGWQRCIGTRPRCSSAPRNSPRVPSDRSSPRSS